MSSWEYQAPARLVICLSKQLPSELHLGLQLIALKGWQSSMTSGMETAAGVRAVKALKEAGHPEAVRFCGTKKVGTKAFTSCRCCSRYGARIICRIHLSGSGSRYVCYA